MIKKAAASILVGATFSCAAAVLMAQGRPRARELGVAPGIYPPGPLNAITDVGGVRVGHTTVIEGDAVRTGVTAVLPHAGNIFQEKVAGAVFVGNAFGKLAGSTQVAELGTRARQVLPTDAVSPLFQAALEATEEAVYNSLLRATTVRSRFGVAEAIPIERLRELLRK